MKRTYLLLILCVAFCGLKAQSDVDTLRLSTYLLQVEDSSRCMGSIAIMKDGKCIFTRRLGKNLVEKDRKVSKPLYRVGSITKMFTAVLIYRQVEKGTMSLDDKLADYFPEVPRAKDITLYQLLEHTAGLGNYILKDDSIYTWTFSPVSHEDIMKDIVRQGLLYEPGKDFKYSNSGYYLLARILEKKLGKPYTDIVEESIIKPLGLKHTHSGIVAAPDVLLPYNKNELGEWVEVPDFYFPNVSGVGDIASTPEDINLFLHSLFAGKLISPKHLQIMKPYGTDRWGRGMMCMPYQEHVYCGHTGDTFGIHSLGVYNEKEDVSIAVNINGATFPFNEFLLGIFKSLYGE